MSETVAGEAWPWAGSYPGGASPDVLLDTYPVPRILSEAARQWPQRTAFEFRDTSIDYETLWRTAVQTAAALTREGIAKGERVALLLPNTLYHPFAFFGALVAGAVIVHLSPLDSPKVIAHKLTDSGARTIVTTNIGNLAVEAAKLLGAKLVDRVVVGDDGRFGPSPLAGPMPSGDGVIGWDDFLVPGRTDIELPGAGASDLALLQYTGGTTGMPKAAMLTHANLTAAVSSYTLWARADGLMRPEQERVLLVLPLFHIYALIAVMLRSMIDGQTLVLHTRFDPETALAEIERGVTVFPGVPTMWIAMCALPGFAERNLNSLHYAASGGAPLPVEVARRLKEMAGIELLGGWGMTETSPAGTNIPRNRPDKSGTVGLPLPGIRMRVVALDDPRRELAPGETGELAVRGPNVTAGYLNRQDENAASFVDGWFLTGDIGHMDADGFIFLVDRKKDMIISGGFNVYPQMIEQAVYEHPDVEEVLVIGIADPYRGEAAKAFVKLRAGAPELTLDGLRDFLKSRLGKHEMPAALEIRAALPRTVVGKLSKLELKQEERAKSAAPASQGA